MRITKLISIADIFTLVNALLGFTAIILAMEGRIDFAVYAILIGICADGLDGMVARRFSRKWYLGDYLDVMADTTSFCVAPSVVIYFTARGWMEKTMGLYGDAILYAACGALVVCGLLRLARFCYMSGGHSSTFDGLPSPGSALVLALLILQGLFGTIPLSPGFKVAAAFVLAALMVSDFRYPKVRGAFAVVSGLVIFLVMVTERFEGTRLVSEFLLDVGLLLALAYVALGPLIIRRRSRRAHDGQG